MYRDLCQGLCKGERSSTDSPAIFAQTADGKRLLLCSCCMVKLEIVPTDWTTGAPNVRHDMVAATEQRLTCKACNYDVVVLGELKPA